MSSRLWNWTAGITITFSSLLFYSGNR